MLMTFSTKEEAQNYINTINSNMGFVGNITQSWDKVKQLATNQFCINRPEERFVSEYIHNPIRSLDRSAYTWSNESVANKLSYSNNILSVSMDRTDNFRGIANGVPRCETALENFEITNGHEYIINLKTLFPAGFQFETVYNQMIFFQLHHCSSAGSPPFSIMLDKDHYRFQSNNNPQWLNPIVADNMGSAINDVGNWVSWQFKYKPSNTNNGYIEIIKDGVSIYNINNAVTAYSINSYIKIGLYKWDWQQYTSNVASVAMQYKDFSIVETIKPCS